MNQVWYQHGYSLEEFANKTNQKDQIEFFSQIFICIGDF